MRKYAENILFLFIFLLVFNSHSQKRIKLNQENGVYTFFCKINGIKTHFTLDAHATNVTISLTEAQSLLKQGLLSKEDFEEIYKTPDGKIIDSTIVNLKSIEIEGSVLKNVKASISHRQNTPLLFGVAALKELGNASLVKNELIIHKSQEFYANNAIQKVFSLLKDEVYNLQYTGDKMNITYTLTLKNYNDYSYALTGGSSIKNDSLSEKTFIIPITNIGDIKNQEFQNKKTAQSINVLSLFAKNNTTFKIGPKEKLKDEAVFPFLFDTNKSSDRFVMLLNTLISENQIYTNHKVDSIYNDDLKNTTKWLQSNISKWSYTGLGMNIDYKFDLIKNENGGYSLTGHSNDFNKSTKESFSIPLIDINSLKFITQSEDKNGVTFLVLSTKDEAKLFLSNNTKSSRFAFILNPKINNNNIKEEFLKNFDKLLNIDYEIIKKKNI